MQIGVLGNEGSWYVDQVCSAAQQRGHESYQLHFPKMTASVTESGLTVSCDEICVSSLDAVIVRTMPPGSLEQVVSRMDMLAGLSHDGVHVVNSPKAIECAVDKYLTTQKLAQAGVKVPDTIICENSDRAMTAFEELGGDIVVKPLFGAEGRGILRVNHPEMALRTFRTLERLNTSLYLQRFVAGSAHDIRVLLLNGHVLASMKRIPAEGDFRANAAQQGSATAWEPLEEEVEAAMKAAEVTGCLFAGVDLMYNEHNELLVIEVNAVPGWRALQKVCQVDVPGALMTWLENA